MIESYPSSCITFNWSMVIKLFPIRKRRNLKNMKLKRREKDEKFRRRRSNEEERQENQKRKQKVLTQSFKMMRQSTDEGRRQTSVD